MDNVVWPGKVEWRLGDANRGGKCWKERLMLQLQGPNWSEDPPLLDCLRPWPAHHSSLPRSGPGGGSVESEKDTGMR